MQLIYLVNRYVHIYIYIIIGCILGYGNSSLPVVQESEAAHWLTKLIHTLRLSNFVIISPSMSGRFSIPYVIESNAKSRSLRGFIPIAPVGTRKFTASNYQEVRVSSF